MNARASGGVLTYTKRRDMSARDRFNRTRDAVIEHHRICLEIMACGDDWKPEEVRVPKGDPTCTKALHLLDWSDKLATLEARDMGMNKSTGKHRVSVACDWVDSLGVSKILAGDYEI